MTQPPPSSTWTTRLKERWWLLRDLMKARDNVILSWDESFFREEFVPVDLFLGAKLFVINHPEGVQRVMVTNAANYPKSTTNTQILKPLLGNGLFVSEGALWMRQRKVVAPSTHSTMLDAYAKIIIEEGLALRKSWQGLTEVDVAENFTLLTAEVISRIMFGYRLGEQGQTLYEAFKEYQATHGRMHLMELLRFPSWIPRPSLVKGRRAVARFDSVLLQILEAGKSAPSSNVPNLLDMLLSYRDEHGEPMAHSLIRDEMASIFLAGHETTAITLGWVFYLLDRHPEVEQRLHEELDRVLNGRAPTFEDVAKLVYTRAIIDETLRLYPPVYVFSRQALADDTVMGHHIPAGSFVSLASWLIHRHELYWERPTAFVPDRFLPENADKIRPYTYFPFGAGPRMCLGKNLGLLESVLLLAIIAQSFKLRLKPGVEIAPLGRMTLRPDQALPMLLEPRSNQP